MKWGKALPALALSAILFSNQIPANASSFTSPEQLVRSAESYAGSLKWAISVEGTGNGKTIPWNYYNGAKLAYQKALSAVAKLPKGKTKTDFQTRLEKNVNLFISTTPNKVGRAVAYIDAINAGLKIEKKKNQLNNRLAATIMDDVTEKYYHELSLEIKKQAYLLDRVYGETTRESIRSHFKGSAEQARLKALYPVSIHMALDQLKADLDIQNYIKAIPLQNEIDVLFKDSMEKDLITSPMYDQLHSKYEHLQKMIPTLIDFTFTDIEGKYSQSGDLNKGRNFKTDPKHLNGFDTFSFRLYEEAAHVTVALSTGDIRETVFTGDNISSAEMNLNEFNTMHGITDLKDLTFEITVIDKKGRTKVETGTMFGYVPFVFTNGTYRSKKGYTLDIPSNYELRLGDGDSEVITSTNKEAAGDWLSVKMLSPDSNLAKVREEAIEFLKTAPGEPKDFDGANPFTGTDAEVKLHLIVKDKDFTEEIIVLKVDNQLIKFTDHIDDTYLYPEVLGAFTNIMKSINYN